jgi:hypothetical protein
MRPRGLVGGLGAVCRKGSARALRQGRGERKQRGFRAGPLQATARFSVAGARQTKDGEQATEFLSVRQIEFD